MNHVITAIVLSIPLAVSGVFHMAVVKTNFISRLNRPLNAPLFGRNKTWRGLLILPVLTIPGVWLAKALAPGAFVDVSTIPLGVALGLGYALFELPNSYMKRKLGIAPGKLPARNRFLFALIDQTDSAVGCVLVYAVMTDAAAMSLLACLLLGPAVHLAVNVSLWTVGLRKEPI